MAPIIIRALGTVSTKLGEWLEKTGIECTYLPSSTKLGSAKIIRKVMEGIPKAARTTLVDSILFTSN